MNQASPASLASIERTINAVWRIESNKLLGALTRMLRDVGRAEEIAQDAFVAALEAWPRSGIPENPGAWLMATAKRRAIDQLRRDLRLERKQDAIGQEQETRQAIAVIGLGVPEQDDLLGLIFMLCHPILAAEGRVALTLRLLGGLTTDEIARAFLIPEATVAQRIVRAKRTLTGARVPFEIPQGEDLAARLPAVLEVIYLIFNEGYAATSGDDWMRPGLCEDALRLGRILAELMPGQAEIHGLVALLEIQASRMRARTDRKGDPILLLEQNRAHWNRLLIERGLAALARAEKLGGGLGEYSLQAAIAACHARARTAAETDWPRIAALYDALGEVAPSPIVELNRGVALAMAYGPATGLEVVDALRAEPTLQGYHLLPGVRGTLLARLGRFDEALAEFKAAADLTRNQRERELLLARAAACARGEVPER